MGRHRLASIALALSLAAGSAVLHLASPATGQAQAEPNEASVARLGMLSRKERKLLSPHLERGPVAFVEFATRTELPAVILATRVRAPAERLVDLVSSPRDYPRFMPSLDEVLIRSEHGATTGYGWRWKTAIFTLQGHNVMTVYPASRQRAAVQGYRVGIRSVRGDLGEGRMMWRVYPEGPNQSLLVLASRVDMRRSNYVTRQLSAGGNGVNRTINMALGFVMMLATKAQAEGSTASSSSAGDGPLPPLRAPQIDLDALASMLTRGDLLLMDLHGDRVAQVTVAGRMGKSVRKVRSIMSDPEQFGRSLVHGSRAEVVRRQGATVLFDWSIPLPLVGASGRMRLEDRGSTVRIDAVDGHLRGGRWRFQTHAYPWGEAAVVGWGRFDPADASWLLRQLVAGIRYFDHGLKAGSQVMVMRSIRSRVWGRHLRSP
jgi:hypothetical protein